jgi:hypothetical protein
MTTTEDVTPVATTAHCPLCGRTVPVFCTEDDRRPRYNGHTCRTGPRSGRECDNTDQLVTEQHR